jgi:orotidine-5'-phosphate decarboxylase
LRPPESSRSLTAAVEAVEAFCRSVIETVAPLVPAIKINSAFFEVFHAAGVDAYYRTVAFAHKKNLLVIGDIKRGDIGSTATLYARGHLDPPRFDEIDPNCMPDCVTLAGYLGENAVRPFIDICREHGRGVFILVRPSDPGADLIHEFRGGGGQDATAFYEFMADLVDKWGGGEGLIGSCGYSSVGAVVAAKDAQSTQTLRERMPRTMFLIPGYGAQGGTADGCRACFKPDRSGGIVNASRSVIYAFEKEEYAERFADDWRKCVEQACRDFVSDLAGMFRGP